MPPVFRDATPADVPLILTLVRELGEYETMLDQVKATEAGLHAALFGAPRRVEAMIVERDGQTAGFFMWYYGFSSFSGAPILFVEDIYIRPDFRRGGIGHAVFRHLARLAVAQGCARMEWIVLDWNAPAIAFYGRIGAQPTRGWTTQRLTGAALAALAA